MGLAPISGSVEAHFETGGVVLSVSVDSTMEECQMRVK